mmetsp:Transcript_35487/g.65171  ORF Transcript_35487/g.65171 Transcript_35487/m.65171 type:complete len:131 (+) Transcript_35487:873-1265(+)
MPSRLNEQGTMGSGIVADTMPQKKAYTFPLQHQSDPAVRSQILLGFQFPETNCAIQSGHHLYLLLAFPQDTRNKIHMNQKQLATNQGEARSGLNLASAESKREGMKNILPEPRVGRKNDLTHCLKKILDI